MKFFGSRSSGIILIIGLIFVVMAGAAVMWLIFQPQRPGELLPPLPEPTKMQINEEDQPPVLTFEELNSEPLNYLNQDIQVSGNFLILSPPDCQDFRGPKPGWALVSNNLQLDALGFERIVQLLEPDTSMVVQGIWEHYEGPLGCGKGPDRGSIWFLDVKKIIQPNPLVASGIDGHNVVIIGGGQDIPSLQPTSGTPSILPPTATQDATVPAGSTQTVTATATTLVTLTATPLPDGSPAPTVTPTPVNGSTEVPLSPTPSLETTTPIATSTPTAQATNGPGSTPPTLTPEPPPVLPTSTETNGGYPGPNPGTATATATTNPYP